jgi:hypothetical protein
VFGADRNDLLCDVFVLGCSFPGNNLRGLEAKLWEAIHFVTVTGDRGGRFCSWGQAHRRFWLQEFLVNHF